MVQLVVNLAGMRKAGCSKSRPRQTYVDKTGSDSSTAKRSKTSVSDTVGLPGRNRCSMLKNTYCSISINHALTANVYVLLRIPVLCSYDQRRATSNASDL